MRKWVLLLALSLAVFGFSTQAAPPDASQVNPAAPTVQNAPAPAPLAPGAPAQAAIPQGGVYFDEAMLKASLLEEMLGKKIEQILTGSLNPDDKFGFHVHVTLAKRKETPPELAGQGEEKTDQSNDLESEEADDEWSEIERSLIEDPATPALGALPMDVEYLIKKYEDQVKKFESLEAQLKGKVEDIKKEAETKASQKNRSHFEVTRVAMFVTLDENIAPQMVTRIESDLNSAFYPVFGSNLDLKVKTAALIPSFWHRIKEALTGFEVPLIVFLICLFGIIGLVLQKIIPSWPIRQQIRTESIQKTHSESLDRTEIKNEIKKELAHKKDVTSKLEKIERDLREDEKDDEKEESKLLKQPLSIDDLKKEIVEFEKRIVAIAKTKPTVVKTMIQVWMSEATGIKKIALVLSTLSKYHVSISRVGVRPDIMKAIRDFRTELPSLSIEEIHFRLEEIEWELVSTEYFGEEKAASPFIFLETLTDHAIGELLSRETTEAQMAVLFGLDEKRATRIISGLEAEQRKTILKEIMEAEPLEAQQMSELVTRLQKSAEELSKSQSSLASGGNLGVGVLVPILQQMDFDTAYVTSKGLLDLDDSSKTLLKSRYFNVALLPEASEQFLQTIFASQTGEWASAVLSQYPEEFRKKVIAMLPPMLQEILNDQGGAPIVPAYALQLLRELNESVQGQLQNNELSLQQIYGSTGDQQNAA